MKIQESYKNSLKNEEKAKYQKNQKIEEKKLKKNEEKQKK